MKKWTIYKIDSPDGRVYIGCTSDYERRKRAYLTMAPSIKKQRLLFGSFVTHGIESHTFIEIDSFHSEKRYSEGKEMFWIRSFMSNCSKWPEQKGLNLTNGGKGNLGLKMSEDAKSMLSQKHKGRKFSEQHIFNLKKSHTDNMKWCRPIGRYNKEGDLLEKYTSIKRCADQLGCGPSQISDCLAGNRKTCRGFIFKYI